MPSVSRRDSEHALQVMREERIADLDSIQPRISGLTFEELRVDVRESGLYIADDLLLSLISALRAGKHVMLRGAPGTGKTALALAVAGAAARIGISGGPVLATGTADWTSVETVGTYRLNRQRELTFRPGHVLAAMQENRWLIIDELNRADIDKAVGQLFTVLSGHAVTLPFEVDEPDADSEAHEEDGHVPTYISIVPPAAQAPADTVPIRIAETWRMIATLNNQDQDLLFEMSEALLRRFAIIDVPTPSHEQWAEILASRGRTGAEELDEALLDLVTSSVFDQRPLGAAVVLDAASHLTRLLELREEGAVLSLTQCLESALDLYIRPHLRLPSGDHLLVDADALLRAREVSPSMP